MTSLIADSDKSTKCHDMTLPTKRTTRIALLSLKDASFLQPLYLMFDSCFQSPFNSSKAV